MSAQNGAAQVTTTADRDRISVEAVAVFLLRVGEQERAGLTSRCAILAAGSEFGIDPATILCRVGEVAD